MASTITSLYDAAAALLAASVAALNLTDAGAPARAYVSDGPVALDCEQVTVEVSGIGQADTGPLSPSLAPALRPHIASLGLVGLKITATRCVPVVNDRGNAPAVAAIQASAVKVLADGWSIWNYLHQQIRVGALFPGCQGVFIDPGQPIDTSGGIGGWTFTVRVPLDGIPPA